MERVVKYFVKYPVFANAIIIIIAVWGMFSFSEIKQSFFPELTPRNITITVAYPGASPEEMEEGVTFKVEEALKGVVGIEEINSTSSENFASISIMTLEEYDIDEVVTEVKNAVDRINSFPENAEKPVVFKQKPVDRAAYLSLSGNVDLFTLKKAAEDVEDDFLASGVISQIQLYGFPDLEISIEVKEEDMLRYGLTFDQVAAAVRLNNRDVSGGTIKTSIEEIRIRSNAKEYDPGLIGEIIVRANPDGSHLLLRDIANITLQFADVPNKFYMEGNRAVSFNIQKLPEEDLQEISKYLDEYISEFNSSHDNLEMLTTFDFYSLLGDRLKLLRTNGLIGLSLVLFALGFFLSLRLSFWVAIGIPISFLGMFIVALLAGITINMLSLFGMILVIGILVDDGIVVGENIYSHFEKGDSAGKAAVKGTMEVMPAVFTSVTTTIIAFIPLMLLDNNGFTKEMSVVVIACLAFSLVEAFLILPSHLASPKILSKEGSAGWYLKFREAVENGLDKFRKRRYGKALEFLLKWRWVTFTIPIIFMLLVAGMLSGGIIKSTIFPSIPFDSFNVNIALKPGTRESITEEYLNRFEKAVWEVNRDLQEERNEKDSIIAYAAVNVGSAFNGTESGSHAGNIYISLANMEEKDISSFYVADKVRKKIGSVTSAEKFSVGGVNRFGSPVTVALTGKDLDDLTKAKTYLIDGLKTIPALTDIKDNSATGMREIEIELKPKAYFLGMTHNEIARQIRQGFFGEEVQRLQIGSDEVRVWVRYPLEDRVQINQLERMKIKGNGGVEYPLEEVANYTVKRGVININHFQGKREMRIEADLLDPYEPVPPILEKIRRDIIPEIEKQYPSVAYSFEGQSRRAGRTFESMQKFFPLAFGMMFFVIALSFRSFYQAFLIFLLIPIGLFCAIFGHWFHGQPVSILSSYGMIALSGVIINDAVVMLDKYNRNLREGMTVFEAAKSAGIARFRAIMLTSITTVAGLFPLILEGSFQAQFLIPMAISVAYGVLFGTMFILLFFPVLIMVFNDIKLYATWARRMLTGAVKDYMPEKPTHEDVEPAVIEIKNKVEF